MLERNYYSVHMGRQSGKSGSHLSEQIGQDCMEELRDIEVEWFAEGLTAGQWQNML